MPSQKRPHDALSEDEEDDAELRRNNHNIHEDSEDDDEDEEDEDVEGDQQETDDDGSASSSCSDKDEFILVKLAEIRKEVQCPICLGIIRKTRTVMECLHRFCRECIDKSMRMGNNECPACRAHCASRRSLRDDPNYDALIAALYPDIDKTEAEEFAFEEEEKARNKQIQASIAETSRRQLEALGKKRTTAKATASVFMRRSQANTRNLRGRRRKSSEPQESENEEDGVNDDVGKDSSSSEEHEPCTKVRPRRHKRWGSGVTGVRSSLPSSSAEGGCDDNDVEAPNREMTGVSIGTSEILTWGRGGIRSHTRHGSLSNGAGKSSRNTRVSKLMDHIRKLPKNNHKDADKNFLPNWPLRQGDYLESAKVCAQFINGAIPPAESTFQRRRPREKVFNDANIHLAGLMATYAEMSRDWRELIIAEEERKTELEAARRRAEAAEADKKDLAWRLSTAESEKEKLVADFAQEKAKWQESWKGANATMEALRTKNQLEVQATEEARSLATTLGKRVEQRDAEIKRLQGHVQALEATAANAEEERRNVADVNMALEKQVAELAADRQWLMSHGLSGAGIGLLQSDEYIALLNGFISANRLVAREKGVREGYAHCEQKLPIESFPLSKERAEKLLEDQARRYTYASHPFLEQFQRLGADPDMATLKALLSFDETASSPQDQSGAGPSQKPSGSTDAVYIGDERLDFGDSEEELDDSDEDVAGGD